MQTWYFEWEALRILQRLAGFQGLEFQLQGLFTTLNPNP